jgi:hypothetical protein
MLFYGKNQTAAWKAYSAAKYPTPHSQAAFRAVLAPRRFIEFLLGRRRRRQRCH